MHGSPSAPRRRSPGARAEDPDPDPAPLWAPEAVPTQPGAGSTGPPLSSCLPCLEMDQRLSELVEDLTTSGEPRLNPEKMKELKKICKYVLRFSVPR